MAADVTTVRPVLSLPGGTPTSLATGLPSNLGSSLPGLPGLPASTVSALQNLVAAGGSGLTAFQPSSLVPSHSGGDGSPVLLVSNLNEEVGIIL